MSTRDRSTGVRTSESQLSALGVLPTPRRPPAPVDTNGSHTCGCYSISGYRARTASTNLTGITWYSIDTSVSLTHQGHGSHPWSTGTPNPRLETRRLLRNPSRDSSTTTLGTLTLSLLHPRVERWGDRGPGLPPWGHGLDLSHRPRLYSSGPTQIS